VDLHTDDEDRLLTVAASISDRSSVDWNDVSRTCESPGDAAILAQLRILDGIAQVHSERSAWGSLTIIAPVGHGAFGTVYRAFDLELQREVALKVTRPQELPSGFDAERLVREARLLAQVRHPNVVLLFGAERKGDEIGVAMEFINGQTLDHLVAGHGPFSAREASVIGIDLCRALAAVHGAGLLHGDIKAHNVMREAGGRIVLMDFGASRKLDVGVRANGNDFAGTPLYAAPEMFAGQPRSTASDIYSLGVLLYFLATGRYPVEGDTRTQITVSHELGTKRRRLRDVRPDLPDDFVRVVERATAELPAARYQSAGEFEAALAATVAAPAATPASARRKRTWAIAAAGFVLAAALAGAASYNRLIRTRTVAPADVTLRQAARPAPVVAPDSYSVQAAMYRADATGPVKLAPGARLKPGDRLYLQVKTSKPAHVYVVNEDDRGESYLLFPLPGRSGTVALPADRQNRIPSIEDGQENDWQVTSSGGHEHFVIFVSPAPLTTFEKVFAALPRASADRQVNSVRLEDQSLGLLRGVGGLAVRPVKPGSVPSIAAQYDTPLPAGPETVQGTWIRQVTFANP
jgi:tRNA A-37 threonylcarbamoyl transferase component Bud32